MIQLSINLPNKRRLDLQLVKRRKTPLEKPLIPNLGRVLRVKKGSRLSRFFRYVFEHNKIKKLLGANLAFLVIATSFLPLRAEENIEAEKNILTEPVVLITERVVQYPVQSVSITQGYRLFHPGIDLDGITGDEIRPIMLGRVGAVSHSRFALGNAVVVKHKEGLSSLYAHLSQIDVTEGQEVTMKTKLGEMGASGHANGDHLHLEIRKNGNLINPFTVLPQ